MPERRQLYMRSLNPITVPAHELCRQQVILPPNADTVALHMVGRENFVEAGVDIDSICLGALVIAHVRIGAGPKDAALIGALSFKATAEDVETSGHKFRLVDEGKIAR